MTEVLSGNVLRERTIANADQLGTQAETMAASIEDAATRFSEVTARLALLAGEMAQTLEIARASMVNAKARVEGLRRERDACFAIRDLLDEAGSVGKSDTSVGLSLGDEVFDALHELHILPRLRTTIVEIDSLIGGGAVAGTLNFFIGGTGDGKSMALAHLAAGAMRQRKFVGSLPWHFTFNTTWV
jgi:hypothetical protein